MACVGKNCWIAFHVGAETREIRGAIFNVESCFVIDKNTKIGRDLEPATRITHEVDTGPDCYLNFDIGIFVVPMFRLRELEKDGQLRRRGLGYELSDKEILQGQMRYLLTMERQARDLEKQLTDAGAGKAVQQVLALAASGRTLGKTQLEALTNG